MSVSRTKLEIPLCGFADRAVSANYSKCAKALFDGAARGNGRIARGRCFVDLELNFRLVQLFFNFGPCSASAGGHVVLDYQCTRIHAANNLTRKEQRPDVRG